VALEARGGIATALEIQGLELVVDEQAAVLVPGLVGRQAHPAFAHLGGAAGEHQPQQVDGQLAGGRLQVEGVQRAAGLAVQKPAHLVGGVQRPAFFDAGFQAQRKSATDGGLGVGQGGQQNERHGVGREVSDGGLDEVGDGIGDSGFLLCFYRGAAPAEVRG
jgi:hypothetical protein